MINSHKPQHPRLLITVSGGMVQEITATGPIEITLVDADNAAAGNKAYRAEIHEPLIVPLTEYEDAVQNALDELFNDEDDLDHAFADWQTKIASLSE